MRLKELEGNLQQVDGFEQPKVLLEQYATSAHIASHMVYSMQQAFDDVKDKIVADFGCGCGMLSIGCGMMDAGQVISLDIDDGALDICQNNVNEFELDSTIDLLNVNIVEDNILMKYLSERKLIDTVIMNPPFGTKKNKGMDIKFLQQAISVAQNTVYTLHKTSTRDYVIRKAEELNCNVEVLAELRYDLPKTYKFHKKETLDVQVDFIRCELKS